MNELSAREISLVGGGSCSSVFGGGVAGAVVAGGMQGMSRGVMAGLQGMAVGAGVGAIAGILGYTACYFIDS